MASKHKQEDPWAGFVDVLSNILMVVIFLVVILGVAIFALSQQITKVAVENAVKAERESKDKQDTSSSGPAVSEAKPEPKKETAQADAEPQIAQVKPPPEPDTARGAAGPFEAAKALRVRESDDIAGNTNLSVRSAPAPGKDIEIASEEHKPSDGPVMVTRAQSFMTLKFQRGSFKIDKDASGAITDFLGSRDELKDQKIEIRAFAQSTVGSVSEARRIAYYRAMQTRSELLKSGFSAANMDVKIRESVLPEEIDVVRVFRKS
ncbi:hypothetical protein [Bosea sp. (in: a-proteobacteria)]|uniref:hypothetical protein n=1 Tax=Bosea sp. (in: a-proteobacteria) TaxID=1871050 RepID=UPI003B3B31D3